MSRWKKWLIVSLTFLFGLYYILEFMLPAEIGGAFDRNGIGSATAVYRDGAWTVYYSALSGPKKADDTPDEKLMQYRITRFPLDDPTKREVVLAPSPFRRVDYFGSKSPSILEEDGLLRMWYIGLDYKERKPGVLYTESRDGKHWSAPVKVIEDPLDLDARLKALDREMDRERTALLARDGRTREQVADDLAKLKSAYEEKVAALRRETRWVAKGINGVCVRRDGDGYRMWFVGVGAEYDRIGTATSPDGRRWTLSQQPLPWPDEFVNIGSVSAVAANGGWRLLIVGDHKLMVLEPGAQVGTPLTLPAAPSEREYASADAVRDGGGYRLLVSYLGEKNRQSLAVYEGDGGSAWRVSGPPVGPGKQGTGVMPLKLETVAKWLQIVSAFSVGIGLIGLLRIHLVRLGRKQKGWFDSIAFLVSMVAMCVVVIMYKLLPPVNGTEAVDPAYRAAVERWYDLLWAKLQVPLGSTMFSLLAAFLVSAAYRAFRIRGRDATVLAISATIIMLAQVPIGDLLTSWLPPGLEESWGMASIRQWYLDLANSAVQRGISFGVFVGAIAMALRIWLSLDRMGPE
ncbi:MAG: hypothetical protein AMXMBFR61_10780 [Fimbriimonadales bacterium]